MATPAPPMSTPAASRTRDWVRTAEPGAAFSGLGRGGRGGGGGGGRGRSRGGRGRNGGGGGASNTSRTPSTATDRPAANESSISSKPAASASAPTTEKSSTSATPARSKGHGRKTSRSVVPTVVVGPSSPSVEAHAARPSNRRRRSQQLNSKGNGNAATLKVNVPPLDDNLLRPQNRLVPHSAPPPSKDTPPHLAGSFDMRNNIDALVERVRAVAMDNRPSTPGSHIDWAGDDDEGLPDLDDWGVTTGTSVGDKDEMISPIIVDGLKPLPEPVAKPPTPSGDAKEDVAVPFVMKDKQKPPEAAQTPLHPSLPPKPAPGPINLSYSVRGKNNTSQKAVTKPTPTSTETSVAQVLPGSPKSSVDGAAAQPELEGAEKRDKDDTSSDSGREGLAASIHAPPLANSLSAPSNLSTPNQPRNFNPTHNRAHTVGRVFPQSAPVNFNSRFSRSGTSTPPGGYSAGGQHARTNSSPPAGSVLNHRPPHARPVITGDAISRLARTIAAPSARTPPISASNI
ncbi:hypothetical protein C8R43DRAFT_1077823 [Mycena crocata]|nr:hypothetical protein C8R43DRAFT_1077823 [Mycena crocata]